MARKRKHPPPAPKQPPSTRQAMLKVEERKSWGTFLSGWGVFLGGLAAIGTLAFAIVSSAWGR